MDMKFYKCAHCGQIVAIVENKPCPIKCRDEAMQEIIPRTSYGAVEKHVPVYAVEGNIVNVTISSVEHPMLEEHCIQQIALQTKTATGESFLNLVMRRKQNFALVDGDEVVAVYECCNLHRLFKE